MKRKDAFIQYVSNRKYNESFVAYVFRLLTIIIFLLHFILTIGYLGIAQRELVGDVIGSYTVETIIALLLSFILGIDFTF